MKKLIMVVFLVSIVALPPWVQVAQGSAAGAWEANDDTDKKPKKEKPVPEPGTILLVGAAAAGLWGARRLRRSKRR